MKNAVKVSLIGVAAVAAGIGTSMKEVPAMSTIGESTSPRSLYVKHCASCHGSSGRSTAKGRKMDAPDLVGNGRTAESIARIIKNGRGEMPSFSKKLTAEQIALIAGHVSGL